MIRPERPDAVAGQELESLRAVHRQRRDEPHRGAGTERMRLETILPPGEPGLPPSRAAREIEMAQPLIGRPRLLNDLVDVGAAGRGLASDRSVTADCYTCRDMTVQKLVSFA